MDKERDISSRSRARHRTASPLSQSACLSADRDFLEKKAKEIEDTLYYQDLDLFNAHVDLVFFDTTSIKFYGEENELMQRGLSKDKRGDLAVPPRVLEIEKNVVGTPEITGEKCPNIGKF